jgi:putative DNA primase/helicase
MPSTKEAAKGKWDALLAHFGLADHYLKKGRDVDCPNCGGKDRFRYTDRKGDGDYFCRGCGPGDGFTLVMLLNGWDFKQAAKEIDAVVGNMAQGPVGPRAKDPEKIRASLRAVWEGASPGQAIVKAYLMKRGLSIFPTGLRGHAALDYFDEEGKPAGKHPAMLAQILGPDKKPQSIHRTYLADVPTRKKFMRPIDTIAGAAIRLFQAVDTVALAEGIETSIAVYELTGIPAWATISAGNMEVVQLPEEIRNVAIYGDNDKNFVGQAAAYKLAKRLTEEGRQVEVCIPANKGQDWLDVLNERNKANAK